MKPCDGEVTGEGSSGLPRRRQAASSSLFREHGNRGGRRPAGQVPNGERLGSVHHRQPAQPRAASLGLQPSAVDTFLVPSDVPKQPRSKLGTAPCFHLAEEETEA